MLEKAAVVELVDLTPQELLERLREGKVYTGELSEIAINNFFQEDRLTALREISLFLTAEIVDKELHEMFAALQKRKGWQPRERLLAAINEKPYSQQLIRTTRRRAFTLHAPWIVLYVDTGKALDNEESETLAKNLALARELGAEVITTKDTTIAQAIQRIAQQREVTEIIIGKTLKKFRNFFRPSLVNQLVKKCSHINIRISIQTLFLKGSRQIVKKAAPSSFLPYLYMIFWIVFLSLICGYLASFMGYKAIGFVFLLNIFLLSLFFKTGPLF